MPELEVPVEDAVEQQQIVLPGPESTVSAQPRWDADEADLAESSLEVPLDEEDYR